MSVTKSGADDGLENNLNLSEQSEETEKTIKWWQDLLPKFIYLTGFNAFTAAVALLLLVISAALAVWLVALHYKHKVEISQLQQKYEQKQVLSESTTETPDPEALQSRLTEAQQQLTDIKAQLVAQDADKVLSNQELLGIQNNTLQKEIEEIAKPQIDAPIVDLDPAKLREATAPEKEIVTPIEIPPTSQVFTVILHKPADKVFSLYQIDLVEPKKNKILWTAQQKQDVPKDFVLTIFKRNYPAGKYRFRLSGVIGKKKDPIENYDIDVKYIPPPKVKKKK